MAKLRFSLALVGAFFLVLVSAVFGASPRLAHATETTDPACTVSFNLQLKPGVTTSPQNIAATGTVNSNCALAGKLTGEQRTNAVGHLTGNASNATCSDLDIIGNESVTDRRGTVTRYTWELKFSSLAVGSPFTATIKITSGPRAGTTVSATPQIATVQGDCATSGVTQITSNTAAATFS